MYEGKVNLNLFLLIYMKGAALGLAITGIFLLMGIMMFSPVREVSSLEETRANEKVLVSGVVEEERIVNNLNIMKINGMEVVCDCTRSFKGKNVRIYGLVGEFNNKKQVRVLRIEVN